MNAFLYSMLMLFSNAGIFMVSRLGVFGDRISGIDSFLAAVGGIPDIYLIGGTILLAVIMAAATAKLVGSNATTAQGVSYLAFAAIFWLAFGLAFDAVRNIPIQSIGMIIVPVFTGINIFVFIMALLQMATGGFKAHD